MHSFIAFPKAKHSSPDGRLLPNLPSLRSISKNLLKVKEKPSPESPPPIVPSDPIFNYHTLEFLDGETLMPGTIYHYNAGIIPCKDGYRLFYRTGAEPKMIYDRIATCLLKSNRKVIPDTHKYIKTHSDGSLITAWVLRDMKIDNEVKDGYHCEDPRVVEHKGALFLSYTDGMRIGIAKLNINTCETIYTHYLEAPPSVLHGESDGREKNWVPFSWGDHLCFLYSDIPRQIFRFTDTGLKLVIEDTGIPLSPTLYPGGFIRGGCPPVKYTDGHMIWFFHTTKGGIYSIGAYITRGFSPVVHVIQSPILKGHPQPKYQSGLITKDNVVYPCGAVCTDSGWMISMGVNDYKIGFLHVPRSVIENYVPAGIFSTNPSRTGTRIL